MPDDFFLRNQSTVALITGGVQGLGLAIATRLAREGARGIVLSGRSLEKGQRAAEHLQALGTECLFVQADVSVPEDCWGVFDLADRCKLSLRPWKRRIRNQGVNLADALTKSLSVTPLACWNPGFGRPSGWPESWECQSGA